MLYHNVLISRNEQVDILGLCALELENLPRNHGDADKRFINQIISDRSYINMLL